jgi:hypothetical protein
MAALVIPGNTELEAPASIFCPPVFALREKLMFALYADNS